MDLYMACEESYNNGFRDAEEKNAVDLKRHIDIDFSDYSCVMLIATEQNEARMVAVSDIAELTSEYFTNRGKYPYRLDRVVFMSVYGGENVAREGMTFYDAVCYLIELLKKQGEKE